MFDPNDRPRWTPFDPSTPNRSQSEGPQINPRITLVAGLLAIVVGVAIVVPSCKGPGAVHFENRVTFHGPPTVRVALAVRTRMDVTSDVRVNGFYAIIDPANSREIARGANLRRSPVTALIGGIVLDVNGRQVRLPAVRIVPEKDGSLYVGERQYRGALDIAFNPDDGTMTLINVLELESYLRGVLAAEMPARWPAAALRSQAVAARTFTLALVMENDKKNPRPLYDFEAGYEKSQMYVGVHGEHPKAVEAVEATRGMVLVYNGNVFRAYYHSSSGGHTEACGQVWEDYRTIPPLSGRPDEYSRVSKHQDWTVKLTRQQIEEALRKKGRDVGTLTDLRFYDGNSDGHHDRALVTGSRGSVRMNANDFRLAVGSMTLKSTFFSVTRAGDAFQFDGHGFGHGVGLSQYGAMSMAQEFHNFDAILAFYYPGSELWRIYE